MLAHIRRRIDTYLHQPYFVPEEEWTGFFDIVGLFFGGESANKPPEIHKKGRGPTIKGR